MQEKQANAIDSTAASSGPRSMGTITWIFIVLSLISSMFLFALDNTVVANVQPSIINSLGDVDLLPWVSVSYPLGVVGLNLLQTNLFMLFDNKILYIGSVLLFEIGSAVCGAAPNMTALIFGRVICGLGGCGIYVGAMNLLSCMTSELERPMYLSFVGLTWGVGTVTGPLIGAAFAESSATWRWCFYINLCVGAAVAPIYLFLLPSQTHLSKRTVLERLRGVDWVGATVNSGALISLVMAINFGGGLYNWSSGRIIGLFVCSTLLWAAFIAQQAFSLFTTRERRIFPVEFLKSKDMLLLLGSVMCAACVVYIPLYYIPLYFQFARNDDSLESAVRLLPLVCFQVVGVVLSGALLNKIGYYFPWYLAGGILSLIGGVLLFLADLNTSVGAIYGFSILVGLGSGLYVQTGYAVSQLLVTKAEIPRTVAFIGYGHISAVTLALAIGGTVFLNQATDAIMKILPNISRQVVQQAITGAGGDFFDSIPVQRRKIALEVIAKSISNVYGIVIFAGSVSIVLSLFMRRERLVFERPEPDRDGGSSAV